MRPGRHGQQHRAATDDQRSRTPSPSSGDARRALPALLRDVRPRLCGGGRSLEVRALIEDLLLQLPQRRPRLQPQLLDRPAPTVGVDLKCGRLPPAPIQRQHELSGTRSRNGCSCTIASSSPTTCACRPSARSASTRPSSATSRNSSSRRFPPVQTTHRRSPITPAHATSPARSQRTRRPVRLIAPQRQLGLRQRELKPRHVQIIGPTRSS